MKINYTPIYTKLCDCSTEFSIYLTEKLEHYMTEDYLKLYVNNVGKTFPFTNQYAFKANLNSNNNYDITMYSGFLKDILLEIYSGKAPVDTDNLTITSSCPKYVPTNLTVSSVLYEHQERIVKACLTHKRGIVKSPTGSGKSYVIAELVRKCIEDDLKVLITVPTISLLHQMTNDIHKYFDMCGINPIEIGHVGDGNFNYQNVSVGIPNSLCKTDKTKSYLNSIDVFIADEVHTCANPTYASIISELSNAKVVLGLSATPNIEDASNIMLNAFFGSRIIDVHESEMIRKNIILEPEFRFITAPAAFIPNSIGSKAASISTLGDKERYKILQLVYDAVIVNNKSRNKLIVSTAIDRIKLDLGPVIIIVNKVKGKSSHADPIQEALAQQGYDLPVISGYVSKKKRASIIEDLKDGNIHGAIAGPKILTAGISIPSLSTIILCGAGRSNSEFVQRVGRLLRKKEGKLRPIVYDFIDSQFWFASQSRSRLEVAEEIYGENNIITI